MTPERLARIRAVLDRRQPDLTVVTDYVHKERNLSAIVRTADAVGIGTVYSVIGEQDYRAFLGTAKGSHRWVVVERRPDLNTIIAALKTQGLQIVAAHLSPDALDFRAVDYTRPTALLLGAERLGLSGIGVAAADIAVTIPMVGMVDSFNVSVAAGIILSEAQRQRQAAGWYAQRRLEPECYQRLLFEWCYPELHRFCVSHRVNYPVLAEDGALVDPAAWYAAVRKQLGAEPVWPPVASIDDPFEEDPSWKNCC